MGRSVPRIYAALDNRHAEYQLCMIKVEGKIYNHPILFLLILEIVMDIYILI
jgi:hypothetical protein